MHEEEMKLQVEKVLTADKILHEQLFGWEWRPPRLELIYDPDFTDYDADDAYGGESQRNIEKGNDSRDEDNTVE